MRNEKKVSRDNQSGREQVVDTRNKIRRKGRPHSRFWFYFPNIVIGMILVILSVYLLNITLFRTTKVEVTGNHILSNMEVEKRVVTGKYKKYGLVMVVKNLVSPARDVPFTDKITVSVQITSPSVLRIHVKESEMLGYVPLDDGTYAYFNDDGKVVEVSERLVDGLLPVSGITCKKAKKGETLPINEKCRKTLLHLTKSLKKYKIVANAISFKDEREVSVQSGSILYDFGTFDYLDEKLMRLSYITPQLSGLTGTLHLDTWTPENTDIVFQKAE